MGQLNNGTGLLCCKVGMVFLNISIVIDKVSDRDHLMKEDERGCNTDSSKYKQEFKVNYLSCLESRHNSIPKEYTTVKPVTV